AGCGPPARRRETPRTARLRERPRWPSAALSLPRVPPEPPSAGESSANDTQSPAAVRPPPKPRGRCWTSRRTGSSPCRSLPFVLLLRSLQRREELGDGLVVGVDGLAERLDSRVRLLAPPEVEGQLLHPIGANRERVVRLLRPRALAL